MFNIFLNDNCTPERKEIFLTSIRLVLNSNLHEITADLDKAILSSDSAYVDTEMLRTKFTDIVLEYLTTIITQYNITLYPNTRDLVTLNKILNTLFVITEDYESEFITNNVNLVLDQTNTARNVLINAVVFLEDADDDLLYSCIKDVEDSLITGIEETLLNKVDFIPETTNPLILKRYKDFIGPKRVGVTYEMVKVFHIFGDKDFLLLFSLVEDILQELPTNELVFELVSLALISNTDDVVTEITNVLPYFSETESKRDELEDELIKVFPIWKK